MIFNSTKKESLGYRNLHYSLRHRKYGEQLYNWDVDHMEFDKFMEPVLLIEEKLGLIKEIDLNDNQFTAHCKVARKLNIPSLLLITFPSKDNGDLLDGKENHEELFHMQFILAGINVKGRKFVYEIAKELGPRDCSLYGEVKLTEREWVRILHEVRGLAEPNLKSFFGHLMDCRVPKIVMRQDVL